MKIYRDWKDYYDSEQEAYLDIENCADDDVREEFTHYIIRGNTRYGAYEVYNDSGTQGIYVSTALDAEEQLREVYEALGMTYAVVDDDGNVYAHDIRTWYEADCIMANIEPKPEGLEIIAMDD